MLSSSSQFSPPPQPDSFPNSASTPSPQAGFWTLNPIIPVYLVSPLLISAYCSSPWAMASIDMGVGQFTSQRSNKTNKTRGIPSLSIKLTEIQGKKNPNAGKGVVRWDTQIPLVDTSSDINCLKAVGNT